MDKQAKPPSYSPAKAEKILRDLRWPKGMVCPHCRNSNPERFGPCGDRKDVHRCLECMRQFRWRQGTLMQGSYLPADIWFAAIWHVANRRNINGIRLAEELDVAPNTGRDLLEKILAAAKIANFDWSPGTPDEQALALARSVLQARRPEVRRVAKEINPPRNRRPNRTR